MSYLGYSSPGPIFTPELRRTQDDPTCTNKPNFRDLQMHISPNLTRTYHRQHLRAPRKNKPNLKTAPTTCNPKPLPREMALSYLTGAATCLTPDPILIRIDYAIIMLRYNVLRYTILYHAQNPIPSPPIKAPNRLLHSRPLLSLIPYLTPFSG